MTWTQRSPWLAAALLLMQCTSSRARSHAGPAAPSRTLAAAPTTAPPRAPMADAPRLPTAGAPSEGSPSALVTVLAFVDYQCPFCLRVEPTMRSLQEQYGDSLRVVYRMYPLGSHEDATLAAEAAMAAAAQGHFLPFHSLLYANPRAIERPDLERYAAQLGLDVARFRRELDAHAWLERVHSDHALGLQSGMNGTPAFFINGTLLSGARPREEFVALIDRALARARVISPREQAYARMVANPLSANAATEGAAAGTPRLYRVAPAPDNPAQGEPNAPVTIEHFADFQCPYCQEMAPVLDAVRRAYGARVRVVWHDYPLPFHANAQLAAEAGREVFAQQGNAGFWRFHDTLFANQRALARPELERYAQAQGVDMARLRTALDTHRWHDAVQRDIVSANATGVEDFGAPASFVNGRFLDGAFTFDELRPTVDAALGALNLPQGERAQAAVRVSQILVSWRGARDAPADCTRSREQARARAEEALARVRGGERFAAVAARFSDDPGASETGGSLGTVRQGDDLAEFDQAAFALAPGQSSGLVQTEVGWLVLHREP